MAAIESVDVGAFTKSGKPLSFSSLNTLAVDASGISALLRQNVKKALQEKDIGYIVITVEHEK